MSSSSKQNKREVTDIPLVGISLDGSSKLGLQKQIRTCIVDGILSGKFVFGARMPSSRRLAEHLNVSRITVSMAYLELVESGYLERRARSGYYILVKNVKTPLSESSSNKDWYKPQFIRRYQSPRNSVARPQDWRTYPYPFIYGQADPTLIDHYGWRQCSLEALGRRDFDALTLDSYETDDEMLVEYILRLSLPKRGIYAKPNEILITMGAQNALWLSNMLFLGAGKKAVVENPCYPALRTMLEHSPCELSAINVDLEGLNPDDINEDIDVVFTTPSHQSPTNITMPLERRKILLSKAQNHNMIVVEDDYESENTQLIAPKPALKSLDTNGHVVYIGSFSKSLFPGLRLGYMVASPEIINEARALRGLILRHPPAHTQRTVAYFQSLGYYDQQIRRIASAYQERRKAMMEAIEKYGLVYSLPPSVGGSSFWMQTEKGIDTEILALELKKEGVLIEPGKNFYHHSDVNNNRYRLAYSSIDTAKIDEGVQRIQKTIKSVF